ncbi:tyrosine-protein phosphatase [Nocardia sp. NPDC050718]|uniref:tyrosine-protein phosphatase n=1 Tax=Nocardia sp. NPDC050718 TaxID=3155788 RepID=UPI0033CC3BB9
MTHRAHSLARVACAAVLAGAVLLGGGLAVAEPSAPGLGSGSSSGSGSFGDPVGSDAPRLTSVDNFRDVAGTGSGYVGAQGRRVNQGVFYRSNVVDPNDVDLATLQTVGVRMVYDLRGPAEVAQAPDRLPAGAGYRNIPILGGNIADEAAGVRTPDEARALAQRVYRTFVTGAAERAAIGQLLGELATTDGRQLFHCEMGKDRTGWVAATLLGLAGVSRETIMSDFLLSNEYAAASIKARRDAIVAEYGEAAAAIFDPIFGVEASFLEAGLAQLDQSYGSVENYLTDGLGLSDETVAALRADLIG